MIEIGDPKKAGVLALVAVLIIGVAAFRVIPHSDNQISAELTRAEGPKAAAVPKQTVSSLPSTLTSQPFEKPKVEEATQTTPQPEGPGFSGKTLDGHAPMGLGDKAVGIQVPFAPNTILPDASHPSESTSSDRKTNKEGPLTVTLNGIVNVTRRTAIVTVSDHADKPMNCEVGSTIEGYRVTALDDGSITLQKGLKAVKLAVGTTKPL